MRTCHPTVALVGYTNAGKSTLFNRLTGATVMAEDLLFATLDPTMRAITLPGLDKVIVSDTVGFVSDLPTQLVAAFRATLEEVERAEVLLHVRDASSPNAAEQKAEVEKVLAELAVSGKPVIEVLNKSDLFPAGDAAVAPLSSVAVAVSGLYGTGLPALLKAVDRALVADPMVEAAFRVPQSEGAVLAALEAGALLSGKRFEGNLTFFQAAGPASLLGRYRRFRVMAAERG